MEKEKEIWEVMREMESTTKADFRRWLESHGVVRLVYTYVHSYIEEHRILNKASATEVSFYRPDGQLTYLYLGKGIEVKKNTAGTLYAIVYGENKDTVLTMYEVAGE